MTSPNDDEVDALFADIIAHWDGNAAQTPTSPDDLITIPDEPAVPPEREQQDGPPPPAMLRPPDVAPTSPDNTAPRPDGTTPPPDVPTPPDVTDGWRSYSPAEESDEGFVPPHPAPLPTPTSDWTFWGALIGLVGGPVLLLYRVFLHPDGGNLPIVLAIAVLVAGFVLLVLRSPVSRDADGDDGAVV